ncbi:MAG: hypothetical protein KZQ59_15020 [Candidatus Thiodiazotropha sp. (ex Lucinoma aequizonata)]|nr:hypothetical protein [Candidatus Thiodiazotropha sp. (ex Lucinoma aequizonata)]
MGTERLNNTMKIRIISAILLSAALVISSPLHAGDGKRNNVKVSNLSTKTILIHFQSSGCHGNACGWAKVLPIDSRANAHHTAVYRYYKFLPDYWLTVSTPEQPRHGRVLSVKLSRTGMTQCDFNYDKQGKETLKCRPGQP